MPKVRLLAPWTNDKGEPQASGAVIDVTDEQANDLHGRGQASLISEEEAQPHGGEYSARAERPAEPPKDEPKKK